MYKTCSIYTIYVVYIQYIQVLEVLCGHDAQGQHGLALHHKCVLPPPHTLPQPTASTCIYIIYVLYVLFNVYVYIYIYTTLAIQI